MPIRLIKVSKNLNVGINSLVEFLHKKGIEVEANPNVKIEDEQYDILIAEFGKDKNIRREATETREKMHRRDEKRETVAIEGYELPQEPAPKKKVEKETIETEVPKEMKPHFNVVGSIDLDSLNKKKTEPEQKQEESNVEKTEEESIPQPPVKEDIPQPPAKEDIPKPPVEEDIPQPPVKEDIPQPVEEKTVRPEPEIERVIAKREEEVTDEITKEEKIEKKGVEEESGTEEVKDKPKEKEEVNEEKKTQEIVAKEEEKPEERRSDKVFRLHKNKLESNIVVKGSIDLASINDRTRPPRKSRAQRKKERLEREQKALDSKKLKEEKVKLLKKEAIDEKKNNHPLQRLMTTAKRKSADAYVPVR